jgi:hypothetical protein
MNIDDFQPTEIQWCDVCRKHESGKCDGCGERFQATEAHYRSQSYHFHPATIQGVSGTRAVHKTLCVNCYREDYRAVFRSDPPPLPDRGVDPKFFAAQQLEKRKIEAVERLRALFAKDADPAAAKELSDLLYNSVR